MRLPIGNTRKGRKNGTYQPVKDRWHALQVRGRRAVYKPMY